MLDAGKLEDVRKTFNSQKEFSLTSSFKALGDLNRHRIFHLLSNGQKLSANDIAETLKISHPLNSQHLKILEQAQLLIKERSGQHKFYQINQKNKLAKAIIDTENNYKTKEV